MENRALAPPASETEDEEILNNIDGRMHGPMTGVIKKKILRTLSICLSRSFPGNPDSRQSGLPLHCSISCPVARQFSTVVFQLYFAGA
ncbi:hypothetical protein F4782DRAFT_494110 [Xylaria castorea]|nr:hypothetical protein F4782DRAFT_494110 [Xylaria castorea]